jgi:hypothetical protein
MQAAAGLDTIEKVQVRLFEETASDSPVSRWSANDSFNQAVSRPRASTETGDSSSGSVLRRTGTVVGRPGRGCHHSTCAPSAGERCEDRRDRYGTTAPLVSTRKLNRSRALVAARFPATPPPRVMSKLVRRGILRNERFAAAVLVYRHKQTGPFIIRRDVLFPSLFELRRRGLNYSPVAWSTAQLALFVKHMPNWPGLCSGSLANCDTPKYSARDSLARDPPHENSHASQILRRTFMNHAGSLLDLRRLVMKHGDLRANEIGEVLVP